MPAKLTADEFIRRSRETHGNTYDYVNVLYVNNRTKVEIICPEHGIFLQIPESHLRGRRCPGCFGLIKLTQEGFVDRAQVVHSNKYDYSESKYVSYNTKTEIICIEHGSFFKTPGHHLSGQGCPVCSKLKQNENSKLPFKKFVDKSNKMHGQYDYSMVKYNNLHNKIDIICAEHGAFKQTANSHMRGNGCPRCAYSNSSKECADWLSKLNINIEIEFPIKTSDGNRYIVDGFDPENNTIYEYLGSYWHGNPDVFSPKDINTRLGMSFGELYNNTMKRILELEADGYSIIYKWGK